MFKRGADGLWIQDAYLKASNNSGSDQFGYDTAINENTIIVGAAFEDNSTNVINNTDSSADNTSVSANDNIGAAYIFKR